MARKFKRHFRQPRDVKGMFKVLSLVKSVRKEMDSVIRIDAAHENGGAYVVLGKIDFELPGLMGGNKKRAIQEYEQGLKIAPANPLLRCIWPRATSTIAAKMKPA